MGSDFPTTTWPGPMNSSTSSPIASSPPSRSAANRLTLEAKPKPGAPVVWGKVTSRSGRLHRHRGGLLRPGHEAGPPHADRSDRAAGRAALSGDDDHVSAGHARPVDAGPDTDGSSTSTCRPGCSRCRTCRIRGRRCSSRSPGGTVAAAAAHDPEPARIAIVFTLLICMLSFQISVYGVMKETTLRIFSGTRSSSRGLRRRPRPGARDRPPRGPGAPGTSIDGVTAAAPCQRLRHPGQWRAQLRRGGTPTPPARPGLLDPSMIREAATCFGDDDTAIPGDILARNLSWAAG